MSSAQSMAPTLETVVALCKRRGFVYQSAEIYGGITGVYDFGPLGTLMKQNIRRAWLASLENNKGAIVQLEGALIGPEALWKASGHVDNFHDPLVDCRNCKARFRADEIDLEKSCPTCGKKDWTAVRTFNMMFKTNVGAMEEGATVGYLRPETAQAIFASFKNVYATSRVKIPFGIAQIGKAFRNEITPKQFLFRMREFEQMEVEWFCHQDDASADFDFWVEKRLAFYRSIGMNMDNIRIRPHQTDELAHYSTQCSDVEYQFPFGWKELEGIAYRGNFDLSQHALHSGKEHTVFNEQTREAFIPHVVECSVGADRLFLTLLFDAYKEDVVEGEPRVVLALHPALAPIPVAVLSLTKKQDEQTEVLYKELKKIFPNAVFDNSGSVGKRYRRYDEIGTPLCVTYDFDSDVDHAVTVRDRDTTRQERIALDKVAQYIKDKIQVSG